MKILQLVFLIGTFLAVYASPAPNEPSVRDRLLNSEPEFLAFAVQVPRLIMQPVLLTAYCCIPTCILPSIVRSWEMNDRMRMSHVSTDRENMIVDGRGRRLAFLAESEIVDGSLSSRDKKTLILKLDHRNASAGGSSVQYYSRLLRIQTGTTLNSARGFLPYEGDFLHKQRMSIHKLVSVSDDGDSIVAWLKVNMGGRSEDEVRTINLISLSFREVGSENSPAPK